MTYVYPTKARVVQLTRKPEARRGGAAQAVRESSTHTAGILEKYNPDDYDFTLKPEVRELLEKNPGIPVNFTTDNDITGGNSGSPVLNARGELIGRITSDDGNAPSRIDIRLAGSCDRL